MIFTFRIHACIPTAEPAHGKNNTTPKLKECPYSKKNYYTIQNNYDHLLKINKKK